MTEAKYNNKLDELLDHLSARCQNVAEIIDPVTGRAWFS